MNQSHMNEPDREKPLGVNGNMRPSPTTRVTTTTTDTR